MPGELRGTVPGGSDPLSAQVFFGDIEDDSVLEHDGIRRAVWISYLDLQSFDWSSERQFRASVQEALDHLETIAATDVILQVRAFGEALYPSQLFPSAEFLYGKMGVDDPLGVFLELAHARGMRLHAWLNPYRLSSSEEMKPYIAGLMETDPLSVWQGEQGVYLNPSSEVSGERVVAGVRELLEQYDVDGIHLDDYFYPTDDTSFDAELYAAYTENGGNMSPSDFRRYRVSSMIAALYDVVKEKDSRIELGVSPDASVSRNRTVHYADVQLWGAAEGYVDYLCPQIYYGFHNDSMPFNEVVVTWQSVCIHCDLWVGLAFYKTGAEDEWAGSGSGEWQSSSDMMARQYQFLVQQGCAAAVFYRYDSLFEPQEAVTTFVVQERENLIAAVESTP